jgi:hypothetical protein
MKAAGAGEAMVDGTKNNFNKSSKERIVVQTVLLISLCEGRERNQ